MPLPDFFKFHIVNKTGQTIEFSTDGANNTFEIKAKPYKWTSGAIEYGAEVTLFADPTSDLANGSSLEAAAEFDNSSAKWVGMFCRADLITDAVAAAEGGLDIYWEWSTDGATGTYPSDAAEAEIEQDTIGLGKIRTKAAGETRSINFALG